METIFTPEFIPYYIEEVDFYKLTPTEGLLYGFIRFYNKRENLGFYFTSEQLAEIIKTTPNMVNKSLTNLEKKGLIERQTTRYAGGSKRLIRLSDTLPNSKNPPYQIVKPTLPNSKIKKNNLKENNLKEENYFDNLNLNNTFLDFIEHRKQIKNPMTDLAKTKMINQIIKWKEKYKMEEIIDFINLSITNGWKWVFEKKSAGGQKKEKLAYESDDRENFTF